MSDSSRRFARWTVLIILLAASVTLVIASQSQRANAEPLPPASTIRISVDEDGDGGITGSQEGVISPDGSVVAFKTNAPNIHGPGTTGGGFTTEQIVVKDLATNEIDIVSVSSDGEFGNVPFTINSVTDGRQISLSEDGRFVAFTYSGNNLIENDVNGNDVFVHDRQTGVTELISVSTDGDQANSRSEEPSISADGRYVAFKSSATNLDPDAGSGDGGAAGDIYLRDRELGTTISLTAFGGSNVGRPDISADGSRVVFQVGGSGGIRMWSSETGTDRQITFNSAGNNINSGSVEPSISGDGRFVAYQTSGDVFLSNPNIGNTTHIYVHEIETGLDELITRSPLDAYGDCFSWDPDLNFDGRFVSFRSCADNLGPADNPNTFSDIFVRDRVIDETRRVSVATDGTFSNDNFALPSASTISADGRFVAWDSGADTLVPNDNEGLRDVFLRDQGDIVGPVITIIELEPNPADFPDDVSIRVTADDTATGDNVVTSVQVTIGGDDFGVLSPDDGTLDSSLEGASITIPAADIGGGTREICIQAFDAVGNAGAMACESHRVGLENRPVTMTILSLRETDTSTLDGGIITEQANLYAEIWFNQIILDDDPGESNRDAAITAGERQFPFWTFTDGVLEDVDPVPIRLEIWDADGLLRGDDDLADISPVADREQLVLFVDRVSGRWTGDVQWPQNCAVGDDGPNAVEVCFDVSLWSDDGDLDDDAILDGWEVNGLNSFTEGTIDSTIDVDLPVMGANLERKDLFLELDCLEDDFNSDGDYTDAEDHSHCVRDDAVEIVVQSFANAPVTNVDGTEGIQLHVDTGAYNGSGVVKQYLGGGGVTGTWGDYGGGNQIDENGFEIISFGTADDPGNFYGVKAANFSSTRAFTHRYGLFGHQTNSRQATFDCTSGMGERPGNDFYVTLGGYRDYDGDGSGDRTCWSQFSPTNNIDEDGDGAFDEDPPDGVDNDGDCAPGTDTNDDDVICGRGDVGVDEDGGHSVGSLNQQAGTLMHEFGHTIGLPHGGGDTENYKPNYLSIMNYSFQACGVPTGIDLPGACDFSRVELPDLNEAGGLDECQGADNGIHGLGPMDWNANSTFEGPSCIPASGAIDANINSADGTDKTVLSGHDDWDSIVFSFRSEGSFADGFPGDLPIEADEIIIEEAREALAQLSDPAFDLQIFGNQGNLGLPSQMYPGGEAQILVQALNVGRGIATSLDMHFVPQEGDERTYRFTNVQVRQISPNPVNTGFAVRIPSDAQVGENFLITLIVEYTGIAGLKRSVTEVIEVEIVEDTRPPTPTPAPPTPTPTATPVPPTPTATTIPQELEPAVLLTPEESDVVPNGIVAFDWEDVAGDEIEYVIEIGFTPEIGLSLVFDDFVIDSEYTIDESEELPPGIYFWRVIAIDFNSFGSFSESEIRSFEVSFGGSIPTPTATAVAPTATPTPTATPSPIDAPLLSIPANGATGTTAAQAFQWQQLPNEDVFYQIQISTTETFDEPVVFDVVTLVPVFSTPPGQDLLDGTTYFWRVRGLLPGDVFGPYSETRTLVIDLPATPTPTATVIPPTPTVSPTPTNTPVPPTPTVVPPTATATPTQIPPTPTVVPPTATATPTPIPPTPTIVPPTATATPTQIPPTPTVVPPTATATPTQIPPTPTVVPPTATATPTQIPPTPTIVPPTATATPVIPPVAPTLVSPDDQQTLVSGAPQFIWNELSEDGVFYELQIDTSASFDDPLTLNVVVFEPQFQVPSGQEMPDGTYFWRVRGVLAGAITGPFSEVREFSVLRPVPTSTATPVPPTPTSTQIPPTPTATTVPPTPTATATQVPPTPTATPVPPTPTATATQVPPTPTATAVPPTPTATATQVPPTPTATTVPPTPTATATQVPPTPTATTVPPTPTATATQVPPTPTATPTATPGLINTRVSESDDDAHDVPDGWPGYSHIESFVFAGAPDGNGPATSGWRWSGLNIPEGAVILEAHVELRQKDWGHEMTTYLALQDDPSPDSFSKASTPFDRWSERTDFAADWSWNRSVPGAWIQTPSIADGVQELLDRYGTIESLVLLEDGSNVPQGDWHGWWSFDGDAASAARLHIKYAMPSHVDVRVDSGSDDAHDVPAGWPYFGSTGTGVFSGAPGGNGPATGGFRWDGLNIPSDAQIIEAHVIFTQDGWGYEIPTMLAFENNGAPQTFSPNSTPADRWQSRTTFEQPWNWERKTPGSEISTPDIAAGIQELINRFGAIDSIALLEDGSGATQGRFHSWRSYDADPGTAPRLIITYVSESGEPATKSNALAVNSGGFGNTDGPSGETFPLRQPLSNQGIWLETRRTAIRRNRQSASIRI